MTQFKQVVSVEGLLKYCYFTTSNNKKVSTLYESITYAQYLYSTSTCYQYKSILYALSHLRKYKLCFPSHPWDLFENDSVKSFVIWTNVPQWYKDTRIKSSTMLVNIIFSRKKNGTAYTTYTSCLHKK